MIHGLGHCEELVHASVPDPVAISFTLILSPVPKISAATVSSLCAGTSSFSGKMELAGGEGEYHGMKHWPVSIEIRAAVI